MPYPVRTVVTRPDHRQRRLSYEECTNWLARHHEGRLGYVTGRGPRRVPVRYALSEHQIVFRLPDYNDIVHYAPGEQVSLVVDGFSTSGAYAVVSVVGTAQLAEPDATSESDDVQLDELWPPDVATEVIRLPITSLKGVATEPEAAEQ